MKEEFGFFDNDVVRQTLEKERATLNFYIDPTNPKFQGLIAMYLINNALRHVEFNLAGKYEVFKRSIPSKLESGYYIPCAFVIDVGEQGVTSTLINKAHSLAKMIEQEEESIPAYLDSMTSEVIS